MIKSKANANSDDTDDISNGDNTDDISNEAVAGPEEESFIFYSDGILNDSTFEDKSVDNPDKLLLLWNSIHMEVVIAAINLADDYWSFEDENTNDYHVDTAIEDDCVYWSFEDEDTDEYHDKVSFDFCSFD